MSSRYKVIISNRSLYKEIDLLPEAQQIKVGTETECDFRLRKDTFFERIQLNFVQNNGNWSVVCSDNLYIDAGDVRKLLTKRLTHGDLFSVKYQGSNQEVFSVEFLIDFDNGQRKYERAIDISNVPAVLIGVENSNHIILRSSYVKNDAIQLHKYGNGYQLHINSTTYGVYHNGAKATSGCIIKNGDFFSIADFIFYYKDGLLWTEIRDGVYLNTLQYGDYPSYNEYPKFSRNTRLKTVLNNDKIEILDPPSKPEKPKNNIFMSLLPSLGMILSSILMAQMGGGMIAFSLISAVMAIVTSLLSIVQVNRDYKKQVSERIDKYNKYTERKRTEIKDIRDSERESLEKIYLDHNAEISMINEFSRDLFDRQPDDDDFLCVRLGTGNIVATREINYKKQERFSVEDELQLIPETIANEYKILETAPIVCDLKKSNSVCIIGSENDRFSLFKNIVIDICSRHYYSDVELFFIAENKNKSKVDWLRFLPFVNNENINMRNIVCDDESKNRVFDYLFKELSQREKDHKYKQIIVFFYDEYGFKNHPLSKFISNATELSATFVFMTSEKGFSPVGCNYLISLNSSQSGVLIDTTDVSKTTEFVFNPISDAVAQRLVDLFAPVYTEEISLEGSLTKNISLFEMLNIFMVDDIDLAQNWKQSQVFKSMAVPIGVTKNNMIYLDLHDKAHGPHGLVAGTTGSGKSEILQTYILSVATLFHPYEISFVIIDFKGGGMVNQFRDLPHLLGAITNIDGKEIDRSLKSIKAELQKRQRLFAEAEVNHIDKYIKKYKSGEVSVPIPHLILIVDEFAELKAEQPEFMKELISAARIGRSLGVHLILATQKPSGQVDDQIWSNSRFKLCLKVAGVEDSNEVLKSPLAAEIKEPGRAYLQVGNNEIFELFQSAYSGASEKMSDTSVKEFMICSVSETGKRKVVFSQKKSASNDQSTTQLDAIVKYVHDYCENNSIKTLDSICLPSLESSIVHPGSATFKDGLVDIGIYDDPDNQVQASAFLDFDTRNTVIIGSSQYGKTNLLQVIIKSIASSKSPKEAVFYILDFGSMILKNYEKLNHVGGVVTSSDDEKLKNLFKMIFEEINYRKEKLLSVGVSSFSSYVEAGYDDLPHIYIIVDNFTALSELYLEDDDSLLSILRDGLAFGISVILANSQTSGIGYKYFSNFANKIALYCNDSGEYNNIFDHVSLRPDEKSGRCILEIDKRILECQTYLAFEGEKEIERVNGIHTFIDSINALYQGIMVKKIPCIPTVLTESAICSDFSAKIDGYRIPVGLTYSEVKPFYLDFKQIGIMGVCGKEGYGHRNFVSYIVSVIKNNFKSQIVVFDDIVKSLAFCKDNVDRYSVGYESLEEIITEWHEILENRYNRMLFEDIAVSSADEMLLMIIHNNDIASKIQDDMDISEKFNDIVTRYKNLNVAVIFSNYPNATVSYDAPDLIRMIKQDKRALCIDDLQNIKSFDLPYEAIKQNRKPISIGDGYFIDDNDVVKVKLILSESRGE